MTGMAKYSLEGDRKKLVKSILNIEDALSKLKNTKSGYYREHIVLIDTYSRMIDCIDKALEDL